MQPYRILTAVLGVVLLFGLSAAAQEEEEEAPPAKEEKAPAAPQAKAPKALLGKIITSSKPINVPTSADGFAKKLWKQDKNEIAADGSGQWVIQFVAFFNQALPQEQMGIVVLNPKNEPIAVADVTGQKGQTSVSSQITVSGTEYKGKAHTLQVYYPKGNQPKVLAKKQIVLK